MITNNIYKKLVYKLFNRFFIADALIHVFSKTNLRFERQSKNKEPNGEPYEDFITVLLYEKNKLRRREINETYTIDNQDFYKRFLLI